MKKKNLLLNNVKRHWELYLLIIPVVLYFAIFCYGPMYGAQIAFRDYYPGMAILDAEWVGLANFRRAFRSVTFWSAFKNTLTLSSMQLLFGFPMPIILAIVLNELRLKKLKKTLQTISYAPHFISTVAMAGILLAFCSTHGLIGQIATSIVGEEINILTKPKAFKWIYVISNIWKTTGWSAVIYISALSSVEVSQYEAAKMDGATRLQRIFYLDLPHLLPTAAVLLVLECGRVLNIGYEQILMLQNDLNLTASEVISTFAYKIGMFNRDYSFSTAVNLFNSVVNLALLSAVNFISKKLSGNGLW